jgi:predicted molibdopterin-dependent oxidoreductase YjgC
MNSAPEVTIQIDNRPITVPKGLTILEVARRNDIYIPTLCAHKDLTPFGGCRMCIVEVERMRGLPTACTTPVEDGMVVRTQTAQVQAVRREILQLILSEHTSSCLICDEKEECMRFNVTIRKAGVTSGCRYCPNDHQCELQTVVDRVGLKEIGYPIYYRNLPVEKDDPFFDRDYNLCILCGRCVRVCQEIRTAGTLAFTQRGRQTVVGPAFHRNHLEAGCEFCGSCISVCPTGALSERASKWEGEADRQCLTTCALCGLGCQMRLQMKGRKVIGSLPSEEPGICASQLCVKGRFCITELVNGPERLVAPYKMERATKAKISWEDATELAAAKLQECAPEDFSMLVSADCTTEDLYVAQKFTRTVMHSRNIDTSARLQYGPAFDAYLKILRRSISLEQLQESSVILALGFDGRYGASVVGVAVRQAISEGAQVITLHPRFHSLSVIAYRWIQSPPGKELDLLNRLIAQISGNEHGPAGAGDEMEKALRETAFLLAAAGAPTLLVGSEFLASDQAPELLAAVERLTGILHAGVVAVPAHANLLGSILMGTYPGVLPGGIHSSGESISGWEGMAPLAGKKVKVLYRIGENLPGLRSAADFIIFQNLYPPGSVQDADLALPAAAFTETEGSYLNYEGRIRQTAKATDPAGEALPDWRILCAIARKMGAPGFEFASIADIREEIAAVIPEFSDLREKDARQRHQPASDLNLSLPRNGAKADSQEEASLPFLFGASPAEHAHRGYPLTSLAGGAKQLFMEGTAAIGAADAARAGISDGDRIVLSSGNFKTILPARIVEEQPEGFIHAVLPPLEISHPNPIPVRMRKSHV